MIVSPLTLNPGFGGTRCPCGDFCGDDLGGDDLVIHENQFGVHHNGVGGGRTARRAARRGART